MRHKKEIRNIMRDFFSPLKKSDPYLRFCVFDRHKQVQPDEHIQRVEQLAEHQYAG